MSPEVLREFEELVEGPGGRGFRTRVCGKPDERGLWDGWIELPDGLDGTVLRSSRETTEPNRRTLQNWADGLGRVYLEGALNPFPRYRAGEDTLRRELKELPPNELRIVVRAYRLAGARSRSTSVSPRSLRPRHERRGRTVTPLPFASASPCVVPCRGRRPRGPFPPRRGPPGCPNPSEPG